MTNDDKIKIVKELSGKLGGMSKFMAGPELKELPKILSESEVPEDMIQGCYHGKQGLLIATNTRIIFLYKGFMWGTNVQDFTYSKITTIEYRTGLVDGRLVIYAAGNIEEIKYVSPKSRVREFGEFVRSKLTNKNEFQNSPSNQLSVVEQLEKLVALKDKGILSDDEFFSEKQKLLK